MSLENTDTNINDLPLEVLSKIFSYLKVRHRKNCSLVCRRWMNATRFPSFYRVLKLHKGVYTDEPPLSVFENSYHPFSVIWFDSIEEFNENLESLWKALQESVRELIFSSCEGLDNETLEHMLTHLNKVYKLKIIGTNSLSGDKLEDKLLYEFDKITVLDLSDTEMPKMYIEDIVKSFPNLHELNLGSYTYDGWDSHEEYLLNVSPTARNSAFGEWLQELSKLAPKVTLSYDYQIVKRMDVILKEFMLIPNLEINSINFEVKDVPRLVLQEFMSTKGQLLQKLEIPEANALEPYHYDLINSSCHKLRKLTLCYSDEHDINILESLSKLSLLEKLVLTKTEDKNFELKYTTKALKFLNMRNLLMFSCNLEYAPSAFELLLKSFPFLTEICLSDCKINAENLAVIFKTCTKLERIHLNCGDNITDDVLIQGEGASILNLRCLEAINLNWCTKITDETISKFKWPELYKLGLKELTLITIEGVKSLCDNCPTIEQLDLAGCSKIDDECVLMITKSLKQLEDLDLSGTNTTPMALTYIEQHCKNIKNVNISYKPPITSSAAEKLLQKRILHFLAAVVMNNISNELVIPSDNLD